MSLGGVDIAGILASHLPSVAMTLRRYTEGGAQADINAGPVRVKKDYAFRGYTEAVRSDRIPDSLIRKDMCVFGLYGSTCSTVPRSDDQILHDGGIYQIYHAESDSVRAVFVLYACRIGDC